MDPIHIHLLLFFHKMFSILIQFLNFEYLIFHKTILVHML